MLCANCHRELHAGMWQLPQETVDEKAGELREIPTLHRDNPDLIQPKSNE